jgi:hypothetical protein
MTRLLAYSALRLGLFTALFALLMFLGIEWWISAVVATLMAFAISYIFFHRQRIEVAKDVERLVSRRKSSDDDAAAEDGATEDARALEGDGLDHRKGEK